MQVAPLKYCILFESYKNEWIEVLNETHRKICLSLFQGFWSIQYGVIEALKMWL